MGTVTSLNPAEGSEEFCDFLFGVEIGFVYLPVKDPNPQNPRWSETWFQWPKQRDRVLNHIKISSKTMEVYVSPVVYDEPTLSASHIRGSSVVWAEFDGKVPNKTELTAKGAPTPTLRVKSSKGGHEHWYWKLDKFSTDLKALQDTNRALAYALGADPSGWDIEQLLRPVGSLNHKRGGLPVTMISNSLKFRSITDFDEVPPVETHCSEIDFNDQAIPNADIVMLKYAWSSTDIELLTSKAHEGVRSSMLTKLAYICCEKGLDNAEIYAILNATDSRWRKFYDRTNKKKCYVRLIDFVRQKHPYKNESSTGEPEEETKFKYRIQGFMTHYRNTDRVEWIIPGILHNSSNMFIVGKAGSLKTALATDLGVNLALGRSILNWKNEAEREFKLLMWSLEMSGPELLERQDTIVKRYNDEELETLERNFHIYSDSDSVRLFDPIEALAFQEAVLDIKPDGIIIDSASMAISQNMSDEENVKKSVRFLQKLRHQHNFFQIVIHHPRKDPAGVKNQKMTLNDLFGSQILEGSATTVIGMSRLEKKENENQRLDFLHLKTRFSEVPADYVIELNAEDFSFSRPVISLGGNNEVALDINKEAAKMMEQQKKPKRGDVDGPGLTF